MKSEPILLLQWLVASDSNREVPRAIGKIDASGVVVRDVTSKKDAVREIESWQAGNDNTQVLYLGTHGFSAGLGTSLKADELLSWQELRMLLLKCKLTPVVWFGACRSAYAAQAWSPFEPGARPAQWLVGYDGLTTAKELEPALVQLAGHMTINPITDLNEEAAIIRRAFAKDGLDFHVPIRQGNICEYVRFEDVPTRTGMSLRDYLDKNPGCCD